MISWKPKGSSLLRASLFKFTSNYENFALMKHVLTDTSFQFSIVKRLNPSQGHTMGGTGVIKCRTQNKLKKFTRHPSGSNEWLTERKH